MSRVDRSRQLELTAFIAAITLFCSMLEFLIPKPLPFLRLGLANLPVMLSISILSWKSYLWLILLKVIGQGLVNGTLFSYIFLLSCTSTLVSALVMRLLYRPHSRYACSYIGISVTGALASNLSQILLAQLLFFGQGIWIIAAPMLGVGLVTSILLGWIANHYVNTSTWYEQLKRKDHAPSRFSTIWSDQRRWHADKRMVPVVIGLLMLPALLFQRTLWALALETVLILELSLISGRKFKLLPNLLLVISMLIVQLLQPYGRILWSVGSFVITEGSIYEALRKSLVLIAMVQTSQYMTSGKPDLPGTLGKLLSVQLAYMGELTMLWKHSQQKSLVARIDNILEQVANGDQESIDTPINQKPASSTFFAIIITLILYALLFLC